MTIVLQTNGTRTFASPETVLLKFRKWQTRKKKRTSSDTVLNFVSTLHRQGPTRGPPLTTPLQILPSLWVVGMFVVPPSVRRLRVRRVAP